MASPPSSKRARQQLTLRESFGKSKPTAAMASGGDIIEIDNSPPPSLTPPLFPDTPPPPSPITDLAVEEPSKSDSPNTSPRYSPDAGPSKFTQSKLTSLLRRTSTSTTSSTEADFPPWHGSPLSDICFGPSAYPILPLLQSTATHCVTFRPRLKPGTPPRPFPDSLRDVWDGNHVRMPCSSQSLYPVTLDSGEKKLLLRWDLVTEALRKPIANSYDLEDAILAYNSRYAHKWDFRGLHLYFSEVCDSLETAAFFNSVLPKIITLALELPRIVTHAVPLLQRQQKYSLSLSQQQVACLLANALLCTFPRRNTTHGHSEYASYPSINLSSLFRGSGPTLDPVRANKLKCLMHYFTRVTSDMPEGVVTFTRQVCVDPPLWEKCSVTLTKLHVSSTGTIEEDGHGMLQVDFANRSVGGGVLGVGCVQEEIRFLVCPELILSRLFTEHLQDNECLVVTGAEQYSRYRGYSSSFEWSGSHKDSTVRDRWGRRQTMIVAMDALVFHSRAAQFKPGLLRRELNKAFCGFMSQETTSCGRGMAVATGNWGCGAFGGDVRLKALLQLMAAAVAERDVVYFTFGDRQLQEDLFLVHQFLSGRGITVAQLWSVLLRYHGDGVKGGGRERLYDFIYRCFQSEGGRSEGRGNESETLEYSVDDS